MLENPEVEEAIDILARQPPAAQEKCVMAIFKTCSDCPIQRCGRSTAALKLLADANTAWSFVHAQRVAEKLRPYLGGDAGPFGKAARPRRRLVFAKSDPSYSKQSPAPRPAQISPPGPPKVASGSFSPTQGQRPIKGMLEPTGEERQVAEQSEMGQMLAPDGGDLLRHAG